MSSENRNASEIMLAKIFDITSDLYGEMCHEDGIASNDHLAIFELLTELGRTLVNSDRASFWKWDKRNHTIWTTAATGTGRITIPEDTGLVGKALAERHAIVTNDPYNNPYFNSEVDKKTGYVTKSILVMPISDCRGEFIGAYQAINKLDNDGKFDIEEDCRRLSLAAVICGITLESETFLDDSQHDRLTEIKNRMGFYSDMSGRFGKAQKEGRPVSMYICDIDFFKKFNDTYGHNAGDAVLKHVAKTFTACCGDKCEVYRWGGEEFIMVMEDGGLQDMAEKAEEVRVTIMDSVCEFEGLKLKVTMSFGCTEINSELSPEDNVKAADEKLYKAKENGRNQVCS